MSQKTADTLNTLLKGVVEDGTGKAAGLDGPRQRGQDRHHRQPLRRLVRRLHPEPGRRGLGRRPAAQAQDDQHHHRRRLPRQGLRRRHAPAPIWKDAMSGALEGTPDRRSRAADRPGQATTPPQDQDHAGRRGRTSGRGKPEPRPRGGHRRVDTEPGGGWRRPPASAGHHWAAATAAGGRPATAGPIGRGERRGWAVRPTELAGRPGAADRCRYITKRLRGAPPMGASRRASLTEPVPAGSAGEQLLHLGGHPAALGPAGHLRVHDLHDGAHGPRPLGAGRPWPPRRPPRRSRPAPRRTAAWAGTPRAPRPRPAPARPTPRGRPARRRPPPPGASSPRG